MSTVYLSLGSNEGDRVGWIEKALSLLDTDAGSITGRSGFYQTAAWGKTDQPDFLNICAELQTDLGASELLATIRSIESRLGRQRTLKWGPRTLDIDILFYDNAIVDRPDLQVPHPHLHERRFVLLPLADIAPGTLHPILKKTVRVLLADCTDPLEVIPFKA